MNIVSHLLCCSLVAVAMATLRIQAMKPGSAGYLVGISDVADFFKLFGLTDGKGWLTKMVFETRGIYVAKIYVLARLDGIDPDDPKQADKFKDWIKDELPKKKILALYGFSGNTLGDLVASFLLSCRHKVGVDMYILAPEFMASQTQYSAGGIVKSILLLILNNPKWTGQKYQPNITILNPGAVQMDAKAAATEDPLKKQKENYKTAVNRLGNVPVTAEEYRIYIKKGYEDKNLNLAIKELLDSKTFKTTSEEHKEIIEKITRDIQNKVYAGVFEAMVGSQGKIEDVKLSTIFAYILAFVAGQTSNGTFNLLTTIDSLALSFPCVCDGLLWFYAKALTHLRPTITENDAKLGLKPSFNVNMGPLKKQILDSPLLKGIFQITILPNPFEFHDKQEWIDNGKLVQYDSSGTVTLPPPLVAPSAQPTLADLAYPVKSIQVALPNAKSIQTFTEIPANVDPAKVAVAATTFITEVGKVLPEEMEAEYFPVLAH